MKPQTINMFFGVGTLIGHTVHAMCEKHIPESSEWIVAFLYKIHGRSTIPNADFEYWGGDRKYEQISDALRDLSANKPEVDLSNELYKVRVFTSKMEGTPMPDKPRTDFRFPKPNPTVPETRPESKEPVVKKEEKKGWKKKVGGWISAILGLLTIASYFIPSLKPIIKAIEKIFSSLF